MEELQPNEKIRYETLSKEDKKSLSKYYYNNVNPKAKKFKIAAIALFFPFLAAVGYALYHLINFAFTLKFTLPFLISSLLFTALCFLILKLADKAHSGYHEWLFTEKNIYIKNVKYK